MKPRIRVGSLSWLGYIHNSQQFNLDHYLKVKDINPECIISSIHSCCYGETQLSFYREKHKIAADNRGYL